MSKFFPKIALFIITSLCFFSCSITKRVPEGENLLLENSVYLNNKKTTKEEVLNQLYQQPNSSLPILGYRLRLNLYNLAVQNADSLYHTWLDTHPKKAKKLENFLSKKQVDRLGESFLIAGINNFLIRTGEAPVLYDTIQTTKSITRLKNYYFNQGYFDAKINTSLDTLSKKKVKNNYYVDTGSAYVLDSINTHISTPALKELYDTEKSKSKVKSGEVFNLKNFEDERKRLTNHFRNNGAYHFQEIDIRYEVDTILPKKNTANINVIVDSRTIKVGDSLAQVPFNLYKISEVNIFTDSDSRNKAISIDSVQYNDFNIYSSTKLAYKPKALTDAIFINKGSTFSDFRRSLTTRSLSNLRIFNYPIIEYKEDKRDSTGTSLISNIYLTSRKKMTLSPSLDITHSNIQDFGIGGGIGLLFRNVFRGAEILQLNVKGSVGSSRQMSNPDNVFFNVTEFGTDLKLTLPKILFPFNTDKIIPKSMLPTTTFGIGFSKQRNIGLDKDNFTGTLNYSWQPSRRNTLSFDVANIQYVRNTNPNNYFTVYKSSYYYLNSIAEMYEENIPADYFDSSGDLDIKNGGADRFMQEAAQASNPYDLSLEDQKEVRRMLERKIRLSENNLIFASNLMFTSTTRTSLTDNSFYTVRAKVESAGGLANLLMKGSKHKTGPTGKKTILDVEYSQYIKTEVDYVKYWDLGKKQVIAMRAFGGIAIPYGNSTSIPFSRSYFAGGSNDNRGWQSYRLGPGRSGGVNDFNEANMKLLFSTEYRFNILSNWNGALFIDASNIWNVSDDIKDKDYTFNGISSLKDLAISTGFGIRYDFNFFIFRLDMGFKTFNPAVSSGRKWFNEFSFNKAVLNVGINYPF